MNLSKNVKISVLEAAAVAGIDELTGDALDMSGFDGVLFLATIDTANAGNYLKAQQSDDNAVSDSYSDIEGSKVVAGASPQCVGLDIYRPLKRFVKPLIVRGASTATGPIYAIQYSGSKAPVDNLDADGTVNIETSVSPAEGTA